MKRILLVEDDTNLADGLVLALESEGYEIVHVADGRAGLTEAPRGNYDLVLLDVMLPGLDGISICKQLRQDGFTLPILFISARDQSDERIEGLVAGGDDYITKPFEVQELKARIQGIFRRQAWLAKNDQKGDEYRFDGRSINFKTYTADGPGGSDVELTRRECMVMKYLVEREGEVVSRDQLLDAVWGYHSYPTNRTIDNFILKLRKIFEDNPKEPQYIETIRGVGYRFSRGRS